jgi:hypothetical protein
MKDCCPGVIGIEGAALNPGIGSGLRYSSATLSRLAAVMVMFGWENPYLSRRFLRI